MSLRRVVKRFLLVCALACLAVSGMAMASEYHGQVTFSGLPLPGSTVTVTATQGDKKVVAITDDQGLFSFSDLADGNWTLTIEMTGFTPLKQVVAVGQGAAAGTFELKLMSLDEMRAAAKPVKVDTTQVASASGTPPSQVSDAKPGAPAPAPAGKAAAPAAKGAKTTAAGGAAAAPDAPAPQQDATAQQANDGLLINGSVNNAATSQFSMNQAFGNNRNGGRSLYNVGFLLRLDNSALDALPWSATGTPESQQFNNLQAGVQVGGPLRIPHLLPAARAPYLQIGYQRTQNSTFNSTAIKIPTGEDAAGNWNLTSPTVTSIAVPTNLATLAPGCNTYLLANGYTQAQINGGTAVFANNIIPAACVSHSAQVLDSLYPQTPNVSNNLEGLNYQLPLDQSSHADGLQISSNKQINNKNGVSGRFNLQSTRTANPSIFGFNDSSAVLGWNAGLNYNHRFTQRLSGNLGYNVSRNRSQTIPNFAGKTNIEATAGIANPNTNPTYWGPPSLGFSSGIQGLSDGVSAYNRQETNGLTLSFYWNHFRHNVQFGGDFRRQEYNYLTESNPYGSMSFTGAATRPSTATTGGSDFADFLLGIPDTSSIAIGNADKYLRQSVYDAFVVDDFRVNPELSINAGIRWEFGAPVTELKGRLVNLDIAPGFTAEAPVLGTSPKGTLTGNAYPSSLVHPDYSRPEPRLGLAWRPISGSSLLVRAKYDVTNDTSVYQSSAYQMAQQSPLSTSLSVPNSTACAFNIANPFTQLPCSTITPDTFAIDPNFKVGYVQTWGTSLDRDLPASLHITATYEGIKGTRGVQEFAPNTCAPGVTVTSTCSFGPSGYIYRTSNGNLTREMGSLQLRRRLRNGLQSSVLYTFAKMLDDDYSLGAQGGVTSTTAVAQDWQHPNTQRALSTIDQRHNVVFTAQYTTGMGIGGHSMMTGWRGFAYKEWTIQTSITAGSGLPETPICGACTTSGTGQTGLIRPNVVGSPYAGTQAGYYLNPNAYAAPVGTWGDVRRDSIEGPDQFSMNLGMNRTFRLHDHYTLDAQLNATNVLNHVVISGYNTTWIPGSTTFGFPTGAGGMRAISLQFRLRFQ
jgi:trimeric autotransporter adhesin